MTVKNSCEHQRLVQQLVDSLFVGFDTNYAVFGERSAPWAISTICLAFHRPSRHTGNSPSASSLILCKTFLMITGLKTFNYVTQEANNNHMFILVIRKILNWTNSPQSVHLIPQRTPSCYYPSLGRPPSLMPRTELGLPFRA